MSHLLVLLLALLPACTDAGDSAKESVPTVSTADCAKVFCAADEYCRRTSGGATADSADDLPLCTAAPEACGGVPSCDCLPECTSCEVDDGLVRCEIATP